MSTRLERMIRIDALIRAGGYPNAEQLSRLLEVQPRTIFQDVKELRDLFDMDIRFDRTRNGYYNASNGKRLPPMTITYDGTLLLLVGIELLCHFGGPSFRGLLAPVIDGIAGADALKSMTALSQGIRCDVTSPPVSATVFVAVAKALLNEASIQIKVKHQDARTNTIALMPRQLVVEGCGWAIEGVSLADDTAMKIPLENIELRD